MFIARIHEPRRWPSDRAWVYDLVRAWRRLAGTSHGSYWSQIKNRRVLVYTELRPAATEAIGDLLVTTYSSLAGRFIVAANALNVEREATNALLADAFTPTN
jgi:hypothetical protein